MLEKAHHTTNSMLQICQKTELLMQQTLERADKMLETLQLLCSDLVETNTTEQPAEQGHSVTHRLPRFPDPNQCDFFHSTAAQIFYLSPTKAARNAEKISARSALSTAMAMVTIVPKNQAKKFDPALSQANTPGRPHKPRKISNTGLYIKYYPGVTIRSLQKFTRHKKCTNEYPTCSNEQYSSFWAGTVHTTVTGETFRQEQYYSPQKPFLFRDKKIEPDGTVSSTINTKGASLRREHYWAFRRPPPYRDKYSAASST